MKFDSEPTFYQALSPSLRSIIIDDLRSADLDNNGRIDANDLKVLLRKHNDSFKEGEILELSELFYTSLGASSVDIHQFLEAMDAAAADQGNSSEVSDGVEHYGEVNSFARMGKLKTHPLGIGTCASEYMYAKTHGKYSEEDLNIKLTHVPPTTFSDKTALFAVKCVRLAFDTATLWNIGSVTKEKILNRAIFLETIAGEKNMILATIIFILSYLCIRSSHSFIECLLLPIPNELQPFLGWLLPSSATFAPCATWPGMAVCSICSLKTQPRFFLETIAAIPGMVAAIIRHFRSLRNMARDGGMLNMFLEEANNERMHLLTFIRMKEPGYLFRVAVVGAQFGFGSFFLTAYMLNPTWCHRFVGYIEEEACHTYTKILKEMDNAPSGSELAKWKIADAPKISKGYWHLGEHGTVYDVMKAVRADEAEHRDVNHAVSGVPEDTVNPLYDPRVKLDGMLKKYVKDIMEKEASNKQARVA
eukprot:CAMPEP_0201680856 /NCGR_PEP_ID=MMETSP0494-20130426/50811_1 /ASSEMBLY_ACC=CAM_ASM_000839 /TAXON_ID=420259 /ORGANISM="Thalassiosira gravida, Strain GMp14c1" /LENGTH=474 /DNA_ID=CAMNT_0048164583 /DNA_START=417 /DNA_END=1842 /DNA_ORIENTATION=+